MSKKVSCFKPVIISFLIGIMLSSSIVTVMAAYGLSPSGYFSVYGYNYENWTNITTGDSYVRAYSRVNTTDGGNVPAGYIGAKARILDDGDNLIVQSSMVYNTVSSSYCNSNYTETYGTPGTYYYSDGITNAYNGNGYTSYYTFQTPRILR